MDTTQTTIDRDAPWSPPLPALPAGPLPWWRFVGTLGRNALLVWPRDVYEADCFEQKLLNRRLILLNASEGIHRVLVDNPDNYGRTAASARILRPITGRGLLLSEGGDWRHQRRTIAPALAPRVMPLLARHVAAEAGDFVDRLRRAQRSRFDLLAELQHVALGIASRSMFSLEAAAFGAEMRAMIAAFARRLARPHLLDLLLPASVPNLHDLFRARFRSRWVALIGRIIAPRLAEAPPAAPRDLFDLLRAARDPETGAAFAPGQLADQTATMIVAGHETTALLLFWSAYALAHLPAWQDRIAAEAAMVDLHPEAAGEAAAQLPLTRAVVSETLRLYPPAFAIARRALGADDLGCVDVKAGDTLFIWPWVLHRRRQIWTDPDVYDPARFLPGAPTPPRFAYLPFGAGPRICVGAQFALTEATIVLATLLRSFRLSLADARPVLPLGIITTQPDHAPPFELTRRA